MGIGAVLGNYSPTPGRASANAAAKVGPACRLGHRAPLFTRTARFRTAFLIALAVGARVPGR
jgi:hypothetical protein